MNRREASKGGDSIESRSAGAHARRLADAIVARGLRVATAESCTGGLLAKIITDLPGASAWYAGGVIAYANDVKVGSLGVDPATLETHGAVSRAVVQEMAAGACRRFDADLVLAVTGIAGPGGGTPEKPVGTVWLAVALTDGTSLAGVERFEGDREAVRMKSAARVFEVAARVAMYGPDGGD